jgi:hypothetical protein
MITRDKIIFATAAITIAGLVIYAAGRHKKNRRMLIEIADEGYETAPDVLFPDKVKRSSKLQYGPILPS